jgi:hypothetical protein
MGSVEVEEAGGGHGQCVSPAGTWNLPCKTAFPSRSLRQVGPTTCLVTGVKV